MTPDLSACAYGACPSFDEAGVGGVWGGPLRRQPLARVFFLLPSGCRNGISEGISDPFRRGQGRLAGRFGAFTPKPLRLSGVNVTICSRLSDELGAEHLLWEGWSKNSEQALMRCQAIGGFGKDTNGILVPLGELLPLAMAVCAVTSYAAARAFFLNTADLRAGTTCLV